MYFAPPTVPQGKIFTKSLPAFHAAMTSVGVSAPAIMSLPLAFRKLNRCQIKPGADQKLSAGINATLRSFRIEHGSGADEHVFPHALCQLRDHVDRSRHGHRDFDDGDASGTHSLRGLHGLLRRRRTHYGHDSDFYDLVADLFRRHSDFSRQRAMRAPAPRISCVTSFNVAMVVSPGVVMARAPCAAPNSTANCGP